MTNEVTDKEAYAKETLSNYLKDGWKIFIDTCSLLHFTADKFWMNIIPLLNQYKSKIIIPLKVVEELQKFQQCTLPDKRERAIKSINALKVIQQLMTAGFVEIRGEETDNFADNVFQVVFTKFRMQYKLLLITQDVDLANDILALNNNRSVKANPVHVRRINKYGYLSSFRSDDNPD